MDGWMDEFCQVPGLCHTSYISKALLFLCTKNEYMILAVLRTFCPGTYPVIHSTINVILW